MQMIWWREPSFAQLAIKIGASLSWHGPIASYDFIVDNGDDEDEPNEVPGDSDSDEDGEAVSATRNLPIILLRSHDFIRNIQVHIKSCEVGTIYG